MERALEVWTRWVCKSGRPAPSGGTERHLRCPLTFDPYGGCSFPLWVTAVVVRRLRASARFARRPPTEAGVWGPFSFTPRLQTKRVDLCSPGDSSVSQEVTINTDSLRAVLSLFSLSAMSKKQTL